MRTEVAIVGGGPSGLLLGQLLLTRGIPNVVIERRTRAHVLSRIRAGVLERGLVGLMEEAGCASNLHARALLHEGVEIARGAAAFRLDLAGLAGHPVTVYGQTELTRDLYEAREAMGAPVLFEAEDVAIHGADGDAPFVTGARHGEPFRIDCTFVAGCDGFHGVSRRTVPAHLRREHEKTYPFGWLGLLSETPPVSPELIYAGAPAGFALCSMRSATLSRYYIQCPLEDRPGDWSDAAFWEELKRRIPPEAAARLVTGPSVEKSLAPLRSFVCEPMRWGRLFLCGDAAHIVPPTGAKGLNTAASDVHYLWTGLRQFYDTGSAEGLDAYSGRALARVWKTQRFSWWFTVLTHRFPDSPAFDRRLQEAEFDHLRTSPAARKAMAEAYVGLPY